MRDSPSFLVVILDLEALCSSSKVQAKRFGSDETRLLCQTIESIQLFCSSYALLHRENRLCVLTFSSSKVEMLYPSLYEQSYNDIDFSVTPVAITRHFSSNFQRLVLPSTTLQSAKGNLHSAMSTALTVFNQQPKNLLRRILHIQFDPDRPQDYNAIMNTIFR